MSEDIQFPIEAGKSGHNFNVNLGPVTFEGPGEIRARLELRSDPSVSQEFVLRILFSESSG